MASITTQEQTPTGSTQKFKTLDNYNQYVKSLDDQTQYKPGVNTTPTGFLEFTPRDQVAQDKYSAVSHTWEGVKSSEAAIASGVYDLDMAEKNREDLRATRAQPVYQNPVVGESYCSIQ
jgi:hypothetical protein